MHFVTNFDTTQTFFITDMLEQAHDMLVSQIDRFHVFIAKCVSQTRKCPS